MPMKNPYEAIAKAKVTGILAGARTAAVPNVGALHERIREYAFYMTENQKTPTDTMLVFDLQSAAKLLKKLAPEKSTFFLK